MAIVIGTGSFMLFLSLAINVVALLVPYWVDAKNFLGLGMDTYGLWGACSCTWFYHDMGDIENSNLEAWFQASQWLYAAAVAFMGVAMIVIFVVSCCSEKSYGKAMVAAGAIMLIAAVLIGVSIVVFGVKGHEDRGLKLDGTPQIIWGMWLGVTGFGVALVTAIMFLVQGTRG